MNPVQQELTFLQAGSRDLASLSVLPGSDSARRMTELSGLKCSALSMRQDPLGSLEKMLLASSTWNSTMCFLTWKISATPRGRLLFRLVPSMPDTDEIESGLLATPTSTANQMAPSMMKHPGCVMWRTPGAEDGQRGCYASEETLNNRLKKGGQLSLPNQVKHDGMWPTPMSPRDHDSDNTAGEFYPTKRQFDLAQAVHMFTTPTAHNAKETNAKSEAERNTPTLASQVGGALNPQFVEWLMGYPTDHTALKDSEMQSFRKWRKKSSVASRK